MGLSLRAIDKNFGEPPTRVLKGIGIDINDGEFVSITGRSGSGKSTLLYVMSSLDFPSAGEVLLDGENVEKISSQRLHEFRNRSMGFVFQASYLLPELTVLENVLMPARKTGRHLELLPKAIETLKRVGLEERLHYLPGRISGGERQRAVIARSLIMGPKYLFADEPTGNLDSENGEVVLKLFHEINHDLGTTVIFVTHDRDFASRAGRQIMLKDGCVEADRKNGVLSG